VGTAASGSSCVCGWDLPDRRSGLELAICASPAESAPLFCVPERVARPRRRMPTAIEMIELLARAAGLTTAPSAAGRFTRGLIELFGGLEECAIALRSPTTMAVLDGYQSTVSSGQEPGVYLDAISRRFLTLADAAALADVAAEQARTIVDQLLDRHVLDRGLVLACERCAYAAFYPLAELSRNFTCGRCGRSAAIRQERWKKPVDEPYWYYSLDEVAFQALSHDGWDVVEVLTQLSHHTRSFLWTPQMDFWQGDDLLGEIDIIAIADGRLIVGEAKSGDRLEHLLDRQHRALNVTWTPPALTVRFAAKDGRT